MKKIILKAFLIMLIIFSFARVSLGSVVTKNVEENETVTGNFAIEHGKFIEKLKEDIARMET